MKYEPNTIWRIVNPTVVFDFEDLLPIYIIVWNLVKTILICNSSRTKTLYNLIPKLPILNLDLLDWQGILLCLEL